jgi:ribonuclease D
VYYLERIGQILETRLESMNRTSWLADEMQAWLQRMIEFENGERWMRVAGIAGLDARSLAVVRAIWQWRESEGERRNQPVRRVLRDDLLVELARRQTADVKRIRALRGMERGDMQKHIPKIAAAIESALALPVDQLPALERRPARSQLNLLGQFLSTALGSICRSVEVAASMVGTSQDMRDLVAYHLDMWDANDGVPALAQGWRAQVVGRVIEDILAGRLSVSISDPRAEEPLVFEPRHK